LRAWPPACACAADRAKASPLPTALAWAWAAAAHTYSSRTQQSGDQSLLSECWSMQAPSSIYASWSLYSGMQG
jgi:hypothetical protein